MTKISAVRIVEFDAGHRVAGHESKCARLHGHRYKVELHARKSSAYYGGKELDDIGRVIDFGVLKEVVGGWLDDNWDHKTLLWEGDEISTSLRRSPIEEDRVAGYRAFFDSLVHVPFNPTAENMAQHLVDVVCPSLLSDTNVEVYHVVVWETPNCWASATKTTKR